MKSCIIPRNDSLCALCPIREADKTGSHMVSNLLTAVTFSFDGKTKRDREIVELYHINNPEDNAIYYGSQVAPEKIAEDFSHRNLYDAERIDQELENVYLIKQNANKELKNIKKNEDESVTREDLNCFLDLANEHD